MILLILTIVLFTCVIILASRKIEQFSNSNNSQTNLGTICPLLKEINPFYIEYDKVNNYYDTLIEQNNAVIEKYTYKCNELKDYLKDNQTYKEINYRLIKETLEGHVRCNNKSKIQIEDILF